MSEPARGETALAAAPTAERIKGTSLWADAWRRLKKNRMAMAGLWITAVMSLLSAFAPAIAPFDATYKYEWLVTRPPGFTHPDVLVKNELRLGHAAGVPDSYANARSLRFEARDVRRTKYRVFIEDGRVDRILRPGERRDALEATGESYLAFRRDGVLVPLAVDSLRSGAPAPAALAARRVAIVFLCTPGEPVVIEATQEEGRVVSLTRNGRPEERVEFDGRSVRRVLADGEEQARTHLLGTDGGGRDVLSRTLYGGRISLLVGLVATLVSLIIGVVYGAVSGYFGGWLDMALMAIVDVLYGIPYMFLVILLMVTFGRDIVVLFVALGAVQWLTMARIVRGQILSLKQKEFVEAARMSGTGHLGIVFGHLIPNTLGVVIVYTTLTVPAVILQESFLAFIGLTVEYQGRSLASWGALVNDGVRALSSDGGNSWVLLVPSLAMAVTLFSLNFLGDGLRDALDPQQRGRT
ncbi:MAG: ABC transporter permease [Planctomycetota bacterium]|nr:MAG: ABC transporter permease [Planctomycetota bacterium]